MKKNKKDWEPKFREFLAQFMEPCGDEKCEGCEADMDAIVAAVRALQEDAYLTGFYIAADALMSELIPSLKKLKKKTSHDYADPNNATDMGFNAGIDAAMDMLKS